MIFYGNRFSDKIKIQLMFFLAACIVLILPFTAKFGSSSEEKFWVCFCIMFLYVFIFMYINQRVLTFVYVCVCVCDSSLVLSKLAYFL